MNWPGSVSRITTMGPTVTFIETCVPLKRSAVTVDIQIRKEAAD